MQSAAVVRGENGRASQAARSERVSRHGRAERLIEALDAVEALPALVDARDAVLTALLRGRQALPEVVSEIEGDPALTIRVLRAANVRSAGRAGVDSLAAAVETLGDGALAQIAERAPIFDRIDLRGPREAAVAS